MGFMKKQGAGFYLNALACIAGIIGLIAMIACSTVSSANALNDFTMLTVEAVIAIVLILFAIYAPSKWGNYDYGSTVAVVAAIALFTAIIGNVINDRILLISGLFSYNSGNTVGWQVFYVTVAALVCYVVSIVCMIIGAFLKSTK